MRSSAGRWIVWSVAVLVTLAGLWLSYGTELHSVKAPTSQPASQPASLLDQVCTSFEWARCDTVAESRWAWFPFKGPYKLIRTSELGLLFFSGMLAWLILIGWPTPSRWWVQLIPAMVTGVGVGMCLLFEYVMWTEHMLCPLCIGVHIATLLLFLCMLLLMPREAVAAAPPTPVIPTSLTPTGPGGSSLTPMAAVFAGERRVWPSWWILLFSPLFIVLTAWASFSLGRLGLAIHSGQVKGNAPAQDGMIKKSDVDAMRQYYEKWLLRFLASARHGQLAWELAQPVQIPIQGRPVKGPANARHTVIIFSDFGCPACKRLADRFAADIEPLFGLPGTGGVRVIYKYYPLNKACNPNATRDLHPSACEAAYAAEAAFVLGGDQAFWKMHDLLFKNQQEWEASLDFTKYAKELGLDENKFLETMVSDRVRSRIQADIQDAVNIGQKQLKEEDRDWLGVNSTPAVYLDGKYFASAVYPKAWKRILFASGSQEDEGAVETPTTGPTATAPASTQPGDPAARVAQLERQLKKAKDDLQASNKQLATYYKRYEGRPEHALLDWQLAPVLNINTQGRPAQGPADARHTVVVFDDFQSPVCKALHMWLKRSILPTGASPTVGGIRLVFKHWPIALECNPYAGASSPAACKAAYAAEAAYALGGDAAFWSMHDLLFEKQQEWKESLDFAPLARQVGLDEKQFVEMMSSEQVQARVRADVDEGANFGKDLVAQGTLKEDQREWIKVDGAPSVFVDGKRLYSYGMAGTWNSITGYVRRSAAKSAGGGAATTQPAVQATVTPPATAPAQ